MKSFGSSTVVVTIGLVLAAILISRANCDIDINNPVRSAAEDEIKSLPGLDYKPDFKHYSGYLEADDKKNRFWHYWFTESRSNPDTDPLVLWLNGGPGCSSLLGLLTELGPFSVSIGDKIVDNPFAWNKHANVIFMESPAGVGFSYAADGSIEADDDTTATQNHRALKSFLRKFPKLSNRSLYLTGESYAGVYLPTLAKLVDDDHEMNLKGVAIGNGYLDVAKLSESLIFFTYYHGLIDNNVWQGLSSYCCGGNPPARGHCKFLDQNITWKCFEFVQKVAESALKSGLNPYSLYDKCADSFTNGLTRNNSSHSLGREQFDISMAFQMFNERHRQDNSFKFKLLDKSLGYVPCIDNSVPNNYLNRPDVKKALHIPEALNQEFDTCSDIDYTMIYPNAKDGLASFIRKLVASPRALTLLVYNGDTDMVCNFLGDEWFVDDLGYDLVKDYASWKVNDQVAGFVKEFNGITYMTVKGSGHMVPSDKPQEALYMFEKYLLQI